MSASPGRLAMPRRRGAASGLLILLLGVWGAAIPFVGPYFDWAVGPDDAWDLSTARLVMQAAPGLAAVVGGLLLMGAANRGSATLGAVLTIAGGAWFAVGPTIAALDGIPDIGSPLGTGTEGALQLLTLFTGLGALLCVLGGIAFGRVTARLEGDTDRLRAAAPVADAPHTEVHRDRAVVPPPRREPAVADRRDEAAETRAMDDRPRDDAAETRVMGGRDAAGDDTRVLGGRGASGDETRVLGGRDDAAQTRPLGAEPRRSDTPPPPDPNTRAG
jgi:hypothetical protein